MLTNVKRISPQVSAAQMEALEHYVTTSRDASAEGKRILLWMLRQTESLRLSVCLSIPKVELNDPGLADYAMQAWSSAHDMVSANGSTHLSTFFQAMGTKVHLCQHSGRYIGRYFDSHASGTTLWISPWWYTEAGYDGYHHLVFDEQAIRATLFPPDLNGGQKYDDYHAVFKQREQTV